MGRCIGNWETVSIEAGVYWLYCFYWVDPRRHSGRQARRYIEAEKAQAKYDKKSSLTIPSRGKSFLSSFKQKYFPCKQKKAPKRNRSRTAGLKTGFNGPNTRIFPIYPRGQHICSYSLVSGCDSIHGNATIKWELCSCTNPHCSSQFTWVCKSPVCEAALDAHIARCAGRLALHVHRPIVSALTKLTHPTPAGDDVVVTKERRSHKRKVDASGASGTTSTKRGRPGGRGGK